jgi:hypothetical protein
VVACEPENIAGGMHTAGKRALLTGVKPLSLQPNNMWIGLFFLVALSGCVSKSNHAFSEADYAPNSPEKAVDMLVLARWLGDDSLLAAVSEYNLTNREKILGSPSAKELPASRNGRLPYHVQITMRAVGRKVADLAFQIKDNGKFPKVLESHYAVLIFDKGRWKTTQVDQARFPGSQQGDFDLGARTLPSITEFEGISWGISFDSASRVLQREGITLDADTTNPGWRSYHGGVRWGVPVKFWDIAGSQATGIHTITLHFKPDSSELLKAFDKIRTGLTRQYGMPSLDNQVLQGRYNLGDGNELRAIKEGQGIYTTQWEFSRSPVSDYLYVIIDTSLWIEVSAQQHTLWTRAKEAREQLRKL